MITTTPAYYNEIDPFAAAWLRELITANLIAPGDVDERDIQDVQPSDLTPYTQHHFFAGIGGWSYALRLAGWPDDHPVWTGSCPCQPFSSAGKGEGFADERDLWPSWFHLIRECQPDIIFGEQVEAAIGHGWLDRLWDDLEGENYAIGTCGLPGPCAGAWDIRQRLWFVADAQRRAAERHRSQLASAPGDLQSAVPHQWLRADVGDGEFAGALADRHGPRRLSGWSSEAGDGRDTAREQFTGLCDAGELGDSEGRPRRLPVPQRRPLQTGVEPRRPSEVVQLDDPHATRSQGFHVSGHGADQRVVGQAGMDCTGGMGIAHSARETTLRNLSAESRTERVGSPWSPCDWIPCTDGTLRPVEPGTFPLAHGVPGRVGRLRGYGNAIKPQVAQLFIEAYLATRMEREQVGMLPRELVMPAACAAVVEDW